MTPTLRDWSPVSSSGKVPPFTIFDKPIQKSAQDEREYRLIQLANGLQATLVHDPKADKAAASLDVAVGHLYDPDDMPGLAHFCEHLLFMGTEQFPRENEYSEFLAKNNGSSNAYTSTSNTNYFFSVGTPALSQALARFSAFFHSPLFSPSCTSRELNAVDSEHKKNHQADMWRIFQLNKHLSKPGHVWRKFGSGNRESLSRIGRELKAKGRLSPLSKSANTSAAPSPIPSRIASPASSVSSNTSESEADGGAVGRETRRRLVEWWSKEYCASRMRLCVIGKESLDDLAEMVSTLFSPIENRGQEPLPMINEHPFGPDETGTRISVQTIMSFHALEISFPLDYQPRRWRFKPASFISHFVGHEGPGSLHSYLKNKGWITGLSSGAQSLGRGFGMFKATAYLTTEGFLHHREVALATFKYLSLMRSSKFPGWYQKELSNLANIRFRFAEKRKPEDYAVWISEHMAWPVPKDLILSAPQLVWEWDEEGEKEVVDMLQTLRVDKGRSVLMARASEFEKIYANQDVKWETEPWYGTTYRVEKLDDEFLSKAESPNDIPELFLPGPNEFIPTNLEVERREVSSPMKRPHLIRETPLSSLWHKKDDQFWHPKATVILDILSPLANNTARNSVLTRLYADLVNDALTEFSYDASLAGLTYNFVAHTRGVFVALGGYNDKMDVLMEDVLQKVRGIVINPDRLQVMKEQCKRDWQNFFLGQSYTISDYFGRYLLAIRQWKLDEKLAELESITAEEIQAHVKALLSEVNLRMLVVGNIYKDEAIKMCEASEKLLGSAPSPSPNFVDQALVLPKSSNFIWQAPVPNPNEPNSALTYFMRLGPLPEQRLRVTAALLAQILTEPAFNVLRTKEQLGYVVSCTQWTLSGGGELGIRVVVQSERGPEYLEKRVEAFLESMNGVIVAMDDATFQEQKNGLERKWNEAPKNLTEEGNRYWAYIDTGYLDFLRRDEDSILLKDITKADVLSLYLTNVNPASPTRAKLAVHLHSQKPRPQKVSQEAMVAFEEKVTGAALGFEATTWRENFSEGSPTVTEFVKFWDDALTEGGVKPEIEQDLLAVIPRLLEEYPTEEEGDHTPIEGATYIEDIKDFKASLKLAEPARPLVEWGDLPVPKL